MHVHGAIDGFGLYGFPLWTGSSFGSSDYLYDYGVPNAAPYRPAPDPFDSSGPTGKLRLRVEPRDAAVCQYLLAAFSFST